MKPTRFHRFALLSRSRASGMRLAIAGFSTAPAFAVTTTGVTNTYNGSIAANGLATGGNWTAGSPFSGSGAGAYADLVFTGAVSGSTFTTSGGASTFMNAESFNVTDGNSYTLQINSTIAARFNVGTTPNATGTAELIASFTNSVSGVAQDLIYLTGGSDLTFNATNGGGGTAATLPLRQAGNFNVGTDSILTINSPISGTPAITITGSGTTILNGTNTASGRITLKGGMLEIAGTNACSLYTIDGANVPLLKLSNVSALPASANLTGSNSGTLVGTVDLAVAGAYTFGVYNGGNMGIAASSGSATTLAFTGVSKITSGSNGGRTFNNQDANLSIVFDSTVDIGSSIDGTVAFTGSGNTTLTGGVLSTVVGGLRSLNKNGSGTLTLNGASSYAGSTRVQAGVLRLGNALAIPGGIGATGGTSNLVFLASTGVIGLTTASGDFLRPVGPGVDQVTANPTADPALGQSMGFAAFGGDRVVNFGAPIMLSTASYAGVGLTLGAATADSKVTVVNDINLASSSRSCLVNDGSAAVDAELSGVISSAAGTLVKSGTGTLALTGANTYGSTTGGTQVLAGVLLVDGDSLSDTSKLVMDGGKVDLTGAETVGTLFFGGVQQLAGTYGPLGSVLPIMESANFTGSGTLVVTTDPVTDSYTVWATSFGLENPWVTVANPALNGEPAADADNDGMSNQQEYAFGLTPNSGSSVNPIIVQLSKSTGLFTHTRRLPSLTTPTLVFGYEYSTTLSGSWSSFTPDSTTSNSGSPVEEITVDVPDALLANPALFVRVTAR